MYHLASSRRISRLSFDSLESALAFLSSRKMSQENVVITNPKGDIVYSESFS